MPNLKISQLTSGDPALTTDELPVARSGANAKVTAGSIGAAADITSLSSGGSAQTTDLVLVSRSGTNVSVTTQSIANLASPASLSYFVGPGVTEFSDVVSISFGSMTAVNNQVSGLLFSLKKPITFTKYSYNAVDNSFPGDKAAFALYDSSGTRIFQEVFATQNSGSPGPFAKTTSGIVLTPSDYYLMTSAQHTTANIMSFPNIDADLRVIINLQTPLVIVKSPNAFDGINMPASLGAVVDIGADAYSIPAVVFKS